LIQSKGQQYEPHPFDLLSLHPRGINPLLLEMNTNTPRTDVCPHCGSSFSNAIGKHSCHFDLVTNGRTKLCLTAEALIRTSNQNTELQAEVERLKSLMSRLCESVAENWDEGIAEYFTDEMNK